MIMFSDLAPPDLIKANLTSNEYNYTTQSWLTRDQTLTQVTNDLTRMSD